MNQKIALIFLGDYRFDGRCINMISTLIKTNSVYIFHVKKMQMMMVILYQKI